MDESSAKLPKLGERCEKCHGSGGWHRAYGQEECCFSCNGSGFIPTEAGEQIIALLSYYIEPMIREYVPSLRSAVEE